MAFRQKRMSLSLPALRRLGASLGTGHVRCVSMGIRSREGRGAIWLLT
jgi:hypothetical protein